MNDFIEIYDYYEPEKDCENTIEIFEKIANGNLANGNNKNI